MLCVLGASDALLAFLPVAASVGALEAPLEDFRPATFVLFFLPVPVLSFD